MSTQNILHERVSSLYTSIDDVSSIISSRREDVDLRDRVRSLLHDDIPAEFASVSVPMAFLWRYVATPNFEFFHFFDLVKSVGLFPVYLEMPADKFVSVNPAKYFLGRLYFSDCIEESSQRRSFRVVDYNTFDGLPLQDVQTLKDVSLIDFHRQFFLRAVGGGSVRIAPFSDWVSRHGSSPDRYYVDFFILCSYFGVLFENFLITGRERSFTEKVILPAFDKACALTGTQPLIVRLESVGSEDVDGWFHYKKNYQEIFQEFFSL
ncbi:MAG: hypothetical protein KC736_01440 [Candidatus Moranbacteria bacterium]|nr:hypothetical protein [Candidatus Moranbacteria bacterium]